MKTLKKVICLAVIAAFANSVGWTQSIRLSSPNGRLEIQISTTAQLQWSIWHDGSVVLLPGEIGMVIGDKPVPGVKPRVRKQSRKKVDDVIVPDVAVKSSHIRDHYNSLTLSFSEGYSVEFRAYDEGAAYRFVSSGSNEIAVYNEISEYNFPDGTMCYFPEEESMISHYERLYLYTALDTLQTGAFCSLPALMEVSGRKVLITESDLYDYPGMFLSKREGRNDLQASFPGRVAKVEPTPGSEDRNETILSQEPVIAKTTGSRPFPWRVCIVGDEKTLLETNLVYQLARPLAIADPSWIKPGKVAWDWYNALNVYGVEFKSGLNNETYKYYIDFAASYGLPYIILDEGWSKSTTEISEPVDSIDIAELVAYGRSKNVDLILWVLWKPLNQNLEKVLKKYSDWGVKGIKVDFMQRADQEMVNYYERVSKEAAKNRLLVDFHGAYKPSGLRRAYPNLISYEGVKGNENNKWSKDITPEHNVTLPFTRMVAGPMDFTPGAMANAHPINHRISFMRPMSLGTRCHQMAMYVVFESPLQMLCDAPSAYNKERPLTEFISRIPTVWDETVALENKVGDYVSVARRQGETWYIGAMTDGTSRDLTLSLSFLQEGNYTVEILKDGVNAEKYAEDYRLQKTSATRNDRLPIHLAPGGGWVAILTKE